MTDLIIDEVGDLKYKGYFIVDDRAYKFYATIIEYVKLSIDVELTIVNPPTDKSEAREINYLLTEKITKHYAKENDYK